MIIIENKFFSLEIDENCIAKSLILKSSGKECLVADNDISLFSVTQQRPYNNEIKLIHPNKRTTFSANRVRREGNRLIVGFELIEYEAVVEIDEKDDYVAFNLKEFIVPKEAYGVGCRCINPPPCAEFRLLQLPVIKREKFGSWLNVVWDDEVAVNILSTSPYAIIDSEKRKDCYIMYADAVKDVKLIGTGAALCVAPSENLLDCIESVEKDFGLPSGVKSRRSPDMDASMYWMWDINLLNVDKHIAYAKQGGFRRMLVYYTSFFKEYGYSYTGDYDYNEHYPNGAEDLKKVLDKIKEAGITPGIHFLHSHIGIKSRYITPVADHRLNLTRYFTLSKAVGKDDDVIYVEQNPDGAPITPDFQVLKFDGEVIYYDGFSTEYPYCFYGCKRGHFETLVTEHNLGTIGGILDVSEFGAMSVYIDESTSLQDEVAQKLADVYNLGFEFIYFDGSEGTNAPYEFNIPYAQHKVYKKLEKEPLFCEGAAKSHFGWHMLSGGNAFDVFPAKVFKEKIAQYPLSAAPKMAENFTRLNFGWWSLIKETQPDMYEYGISKAAAWNCPITVQMFFENLESCPRRDDLLEVMYRWEDVKKKKWLTQKQKEMLKNPDCEYILLVNEEGEYELVPYFNIKNTKEESLIAFYFERKGKNYVVCWNAEGSGKLFVPFDSQSYSYEESLGGEKIQGENRDGGIVIPVSKRMYFGTDEPKEKLIEAFENAVFVENVK